MEIKNRLDFKINRRKLFFSAGAGAAGYILNKIFPFHLGGKRFTKSQLAVIVKLNPKAVSRNKTGKNNV
jgi:hypothetical protein